MTHFPVLVSTQSPEDVASALQPYHEYECTGVRDQYVRFVPAKEGLDALEKEHAKCVAEDKDTKQDFGQWVADYYGYELREGVWGRLTNPDRKWDWWVIGGRWSNSLLLKCGSKVDQAVKRDVDVARMIADAGDEAGTTWDDARKATGGERWRSWSDLCGGDPTKIPYAELDRVRPVYWEQPALRALKDVEKFALFRDLDDLLMTRDDYVRTKGRRGAAMFALLHDGKWHERGKVGWFATVSDDKGPAWEDQYFELFDAVPDDNFVTVVDCHICGIMAQTPQEFAVASTTYRWR